jgi:endonuclease YncB( thermonuclease family)
MCSSLIRSDGAYTGPVGRGLVLFGLSSCSPLPHRPRRVAVRPDRVRDRRDTVVLANGEHVRLVQIDAPEVQERECYGAQARAMLRRWIPPGRRSVSRPILGSTRSTLWTPPALPLPRPDEPQPRARPPGCGDRVVLRHDRGRYAGALLRAGLAARAAHRGLWRACRGHPSTLSTPPRRVPRKGRVTQRYKAVRRGRRAGIELSGHGRDRPPALQPGALRLDRRAYRGDLEQFADWLAHARACS